jgi:integrase/recombinase XerD
MNALILTHETVKFYPMSITIIQRLSNDKSKVYYLIEWGRRSGQRISTGIFTYAAPKDQLQRSHNKEALVILETKRSQMILESQSVNTGHILQHKIRQNFLEYYQEFAKDNARYGNRSLACSLSAFKKFLGKDFISAIDISENLCERFRNYLLDNLSGETPADYFMRFKRVMRAATKAGYFRVNPVADVKAKAHPSGKKEILDAEEYKKLMKTYCSNHEIKKAAILSLYTGLRWCDIEPLKWPSIKEETIVITQEKTNVPLEIPLHPIAKKIIGERRDGKVFYLPTQDGANKVLGGWVRSAGIDKHITWHSLRHSMSVLLQDGGTDAATVAGMLGHTTTKYVHKTYQRYKLSSAAKAITTLPS